MIGVKLMGGLGNQMFQYALGRKMSVLHKTGLLLDLNGYNNQVDTDTKRHYELDCFSIKAKLAKKPLLSKKKLLNFRNDFYFSNIYTEKQFPFCQEVLEQPDNTMFVGYWQTAKYFDNIRDILLKDFDINYELLNNDALLSEIKNQPSVSLHVRRGDYVDNENANKFHGLKGLEYYKTAVDILKKQIPYFKLYIFSDDIKWCKTNLTSIYDNIYFVDGNMAGYLDMLLMKNCSHNIIANSSFSWWAAWLNQNSNKIVIAPKAWFNDPKVDTKDIAPNSWIKI